MRCLASPSLRLLAVVLMAAALVLPSQADAKKKKKKKSSFKEASWTSGPFESVSAGGEEGWLQASLHASASRVDASFDHLVPGGVYQLTADGIAVAQITGDGTGRAEARFESPLRSGRAYPLDFDPRTARLALRQGSDRLVFTPSGPGRSPGMRARERLNLWPLPGAPARTKARVSYDVASNGSAALTLWVAGVPTGPAELWVDGTAVGTFDVTKARSKKGKKKKKKRKRRSTTRGWLQLSTANGSLGFDPIGRRLEIVSGGQTMLSSEVVARAHGVTPCQDATTLVFLPRVSGVGSAKARFRTRKDCDQDFEVEVEDVAPGAYELRVGGVSRGTLLAAFLPAKGQVEGEIEFDTDPDDPGELLLDFDPTQATIEIVQGGTVLFSGALNGGATGGGTTGGGGGAQPGICQELKVRRNLVNTGVAPRAKGDARRRVRDDCRRDFQVEVEDLPAGSYQLLVDGIHRGTFVVAAPLFEAELEFDTDLDEVGELPLTFEPAGALLEVRQGGTTFLTLRMP